MYSLDSYTTITGRALGAVAADRGEERLAVRLDLNVLRGDAGVFEQHAQEASRRRFVAGWVGGVDLEILDEDIERFVEERLPVDLGLHKRSPSAIRAAIDLGTAAQGISRDELLSC